MGFVPFGPGCGPFKSLLSCQVGDFAYLLIEFARILVISPDTLGRGTEAIPGDHLPIMVLVWYAWALTKLAFVERKVPGTSSALLL